MDFDPRDSDSRDRERDDDRERTLDSRDVFTRDMNLPHGLEREIVRHRDREYTLRGSESRTLTTVGSFRVVSSRDLRDGRDPLHALQAVEALPDAGSQGSVTSTQQTQSSSRSS